jgi:hypothetical protein
VDGYETYFLILCKEQWLSVSENRELRRLFEPKRQEVTGDRKRLHNEELHNLYASPYINKVIKAKRMR